MNILVSRSGGLGDCLLTLPVLDVISHRHPDATITILGNNTIREVAALAGYDHHANLDDPLFVSLFALSTGEVSESLRVFLSAFDKVYLFTAHPELDTIKRRIVDAGAGICYIADPRPVDGVSEHIIVRLMRILDNEDSPTILQVRPETIEPMLVHFRTEPSVGILIHPGSGGKGKIWPLRRFLEIAGLFAEPVTFVVGPVECERGMDRDLADKGFPVVVPGSIDELARIIGAARVFIGNDSGAGHLAAMTGTPAVILYGPTDPNVWRPVGNNVKTIVSMDGTMTGIDVDHVSRAVRMFIRST